MSQGENGYEMALQHLFNTDQMSKGKNKYDREEVQRLGAKLSDGAQKTESFSSSCIYRVHKEFRKLNESAYTPRLIAIGPLHRDDPHLQTPTQHVKLSYANNLLCRLIEGMEDSKLAERKKFTVLRECMAAMEMSLEDAKKCYAEEVALDVEMILVDGCFILELLYRLYLFYNGYPREGLETRDPIFGNSLTRITIQHDLLLLENQIPFLVLERLFPLTLARIPTLHEKNLSLTDYVFLPTVNYVMRPAQGNPTNGGSAKTCCSPRDCVLWVLCNSRKEDKVSSEEVVSSRNAKRYRHILHKLLDDYVPHDQTGMGELSIMPSASELVYAGVKFVSGTENDLFKVKFIEPQGPFWWCCRARFEIPCLTIFHQMEPYLRNFVAFEQFCPGISQHFTSYVTLMDMLVNSDKDVQVLEKAGVVRNLLGTSEDVTNLFKKLGKEVYYGEFFFADTCNRATAYSKRFWPKNMAYLRRQYFASPWKFIAFCFGFVYFGITIAQLIVTIIK